MVDFSFIVSLYVSDLPNVTISTVTVPILVCLCEYEYTCSFCSSKSCKYTCILLI